MRCLTFAPYAWRRFTPLRCDAMLAWMLQKHAVVAENATTGIPEHQGVIFCRHRELVLNH